MKPPKYAITYTNKQEEEKKIVSDNVEEILAKREEVKKEEGNKYIAQWTWFEKLGLYLK